MRFERVDTGEETRFCIEGTLDALTVSELRLEFDALITERRLMITFDLSRLRLIDNAGVGVLVSLWKRVRANGGTLKIVGLSDQPRAIIRLLRLDHVFPVIYGE